jgi:chromosome segregation ATPase
MEAQQEEYRLSMGQVAVLERELDNLNSINKSLTADIKSYESNRDDFDRMKNQVSSLEEEVEKVNIKSMSLQENIELKEKEIAAFVNQIAKLECDLDLSTRENHRFSEEKRSYDSSYDAINSNLKRTNEENRTLKARCEVHDKEIQDFKNEIARTNVKAEEDKKSLLQKNDVDRKENEYLSTRCLELENQVKESTEENREMASLLRQKTSQIKALNETIDEFEDLNQRAFEYDHVVNQCSELEEELLKTIEFNEELTGEMNSLKEEISTLNKRIFDAEVDQKEKAVELHTAQKSNRNLSRRRSSLAKELADVKDQFKMLSGKIAYPDSVEDGQEWTRLQLTELENRMEDVTQENELLENRMEDIMEENELLLSRLEEYKKTMKEQKNLEKSKNDQNLVKVCKELEEELLETVKMNDEVNNQVDALKKQIEDWKEYAENIEKELEDETEALQDTERKNADLLTAMDILDKHLQQVNIENKKIASQMLEAQNKTNERHADQFSELESNLEKAKKERDEAKSDVQSLTTSKKDLQILLEEAVQDIHELEESTEKLNAVILAKNELKRLLDKAELGRVEINQKYGQCKRDLQKAKEHLEEATAENTKLNRRLEIERNVSSAYKSEDENEFDDLYRKTREEMNDMEIMLEESRACVADLEENVQILQHQLQAALTFKLQQPKARTNRQFFGWRGGNRNQNKESKPAVVRDDDLEDGNEDDSADAF